MMLPSEPPLPAALVVGTQEQASYSCPTLRASSSTTPRTRRTDLGGWVEKHRAWHAGRAKLFREQHHLITGAGWRAHGTQEERRRKRKITVTTGRRVVALEGETRLVVGAKRRESELAVEQRPRIELDGRRGVAQPPPPRARVVVLVLRAERLLFGDDGGRFLRGVAHGREVEPVERGAQGGIGPHGRRDVAQIPQEEVRVRLDVHGEQLGHRRGRRLLGGARGRRRRRRFGRLGAPRRPARERAVEDDERLEEALDADELRRGDRLHAHAGLVVDRGAAARQREQPLPAVERDAHDAPPASHRHGGRSIYGVGDRTRPFVRRGRRSSSPPRGRADDARRAVVGLDRRALGARQAHERRESLRVLESAPQEARRVDALLLGRDDRQHAQRVLDVLVRRCSGGHCQ
mmetsp:Transcript_14346/g.57106  ORF Transcript_14346/g.57106 Transcript_14346/m.57106 type:complete len:405 (-) Transcript_14346:766-1980(-)